MTLNTITLTLDSTTGAVNYKISCTNCEPSFIIEALHKVAIITTMKCFDDPRPATEEIISYIYKSFLN